MTEAANFRHISSKVKITRSQCFTAFVRKASSYLRKQKLPFHPCYFYITSISKAFDQVYTLHNFFSIQKKTHSFHYNQTPLNILSLLRQEVNNLSEDFFSFGKSFETMGLRPWTCFHVPHSVEFSDD